MFVILIEQISDNLELTRDFWIGLASPELELKWMISMVIIIMTNGSSGLSPLSYTLNEVQYHHESK